MEKQFGFSWLPCILAIKLKDSVTLRSVRHSLSDTLCLYSRKYSYLTWAIMTLWYSWTYELRDSQTHRDPQELLLQHTVVTLIGIKIVGTAAPGPLPVTRPIIEQVPSLKFVSLYGSQSFQDQKLLIPPTPQVILAMAPRVFVFPVQCSNRE